jgi:hypothetical protein
MVWQALTFVLLFCSCNRREGIVTEPYLPDEASVAFELEPLQGGNGSQQWIGTYASQGKIARFRIEFGPAKASTTRAGQDFNIKSGEGRFMPETGSDSTVLLADLRRALQAKTQPQPAPTRTSVPFTFANIGENLSQAAGGGFGTKPPGNWTALKIFLGQGDQEGEVFLNLNPKARKGQFSMKDQDYGDLVLGELAKVL